MNTHEYNIIFALSSDLFFMSFYLLIFGNLDFLPHALSTTVKIMLGIIMAGALFGAFFSAADTDNGQLNKVENRVSDVIFYLCSIFCILCVILPVKYKMFIKLSFGILIALYVVFQLFLFMRKKL